MNDAVKKIRELHKSTLVIKRLIDDKQAVLDDIKEDFKISCDGFQRELTKAMKLYCLDIEEYNEMMEVIKGIDNED